DGKFRQMQIERQQALAVVNDHAISFKEQGPCQNDAPAIHGCNRRSTGHAEIEPLMRALHRTIEYALDSEHIGDLGIHWRRERTFPFSLSAHSLKSFSFGFLVLRDLAPVFGT